MDLNERSPPVQEGFCGRHGSCVASRLPKRGLLLDAKDEEAQKDDDCDNHEHSFYRERLYGFRPAVVKNQSSSLSYRLELLLQRRCFMMSRTQSLSEQVAEGIFRYIIQEQLRCGDSLPSEATLAQHFGVSRSVVREALRFLSGEGIVIVSNGRCPRVRELDESQLRDYFTYVAMIVRLPFREIMEARRPLEVQSARLAAQRRTPDQLEAMRDTIHRMGRSLGDADAYVDLDQLLHRQIAEASGNRIIMHTASALRSALNELTHTMLYRRRNRQQLERVHILHEAIVTEIGYRNPDAAARAMDAHFGEALQFLIERQESVWRRQ